MTTAIRRSVLRCFLVFILFGMVGQLTAAPPIYEAARSGDIAKINALLASDPTLVNATTDPDGNTPLIYAVHFQQTAAARLFIQKGADVNHQRTTDGQTALFDAAAQGELEIVKLLLAKGATVNFEVPVIGHGIENHDTPLQLATFNGHAEIVKALLDKGAEVNVKAANNSLFLGATPLVLATQLPSDYPPDHGGPAQGSPAPTTKKHGYAEVVKALLDKGASVDARDMYGNAALFYAAQHEQADAVKLLLDRGATVDIGNNEGVTPLLMAAQNGDVDVVTMLLRKGANPNAAMTPKGGRNQTAWTPLTLAQQKGLTTVVDLLQKGPPPLQPAPPSAEQGITRPPVAVNKEAIQKAQQQLQTLGYTPGTADGTIGTKTVSAIKKFQSDHGLPATGSLDQKTLDALIEAKRR